VRDTEIFSSLLGLSGGWHVASVDLKLETNEVRLFIDCRGPFECPECGKPCSIYDRSEERVWRHLDTMQFMTMVVCRVPRVDCDDHGVRQIKVPWAGPKSRFTLMFERLAIEVLKLTRCQSRAAKLLRLSPGKVHDIMHRAAERGLSLRGLGEIEHVSLDEKSFQKGHAYGTVLCDVLGKRVLDVSCGKDEPAAGQALKSIPQPEKVKTVSMDLSPAYKLAARLHLPQAEIVCDRFHIAMMLSEAVDRTRRAEIKSRPELKKSRYVWLKNPQSHTPYQKAELEHLLRCELETAKAYAFKQSFRLFFECEEAEEAKRFFSDWVQELMKHELPHMDKAALTLRNNLQGLLNYVKWKVSNGYAEAVNALIQEIKTVARGFRRFENFRIAILFFLGKLELDPRNSP
jgi:transposase